MTDTKTTKLPDDLKDCITGINDATLKKARDVLFTITEEAIKDIGMYFLPEVFMKPEEVEKLDVEKLKGVCMDFLYSDHLYDILIMILYVLEIDEVVISFNEEDEDGKKTVREIKHKNVPKSKFSLGDKKLKKIAKEMYEGKIFSDKHLLPHEQNLMGSVFMPLMLMDNQSRWLLKKNPPGLIYEYNHEAGPRSINGCPMFFSFRSLSQEDTEKMFEFYEQYKKIAEEFEGDEDSNEKTSDEV